MVEKPQETDESFPLERQICGVPGVSAGVSAAIPDDDSSRWSQPLFFTLRGGNSGKCCWGLKNGEHQRCQLQLSSVSLIIC